MNKRKKYFFTGAIFVLSVLCAYFYFAFQHLEEVSIDEKFAGRKLVVDIICESSESWPVNEYQRFLSRAVSKLDEAHGTYAELFDRDFNSLSPRSLTFESNPVRIAEYPDLIKKMQVKPNGTAIIPFSRGENYKPHDLHVYWRWTPDCPVSGKGYLVVLGTSKYTLDVGYSDRLVYGAIALIIVAALFVITALVSLYTCHNGK